MNENQFENRKKQGVRLLLLREELDKGKNINKEEIKRKFDIDDKTFQRDIDFLRAFYTENINPEIEIKYNKKKNGYILENNKDRFRNEEILAISKILLESRAFCKDELDELLRKLRLLSEEDEMKQVKEMIKNDIEMGLKYFKAITINVFVDNGTTVKRDVELVKWFVQDMKHLFNNDRIEILIDNKDLGVFEQ